MAKKPLWDFIEKRMHELGLTRYDLEMDYDIPYATMQRAKAGSTNFKEVTKQKLALALKCSIGDINSAIYDIQNIKPDREEGEDLSDKVYESEQPAKEETPEPVLKLKDKAVKRKAEKQRMAKPKLRFTKDNPPPKEKWPVNPPEETPDRKGEVMFTEREVDEICKKRLNEYKQKLKDLCLKTFAGIPQLNVTGETPIGLVGRAIMEELTKEDDTEAE